MRSSPWVLCLLLAAGAGAAERRPGTIRFTDGRELSGELSFPNEELRVYEGSGSSQGRYVNLRQDELVSIRFHVLKQSMEQPWRFKNAGSDEKEFLPGTYPVLELEAEVAVAGGKTLKGHLLNKPVYIRQPDGDNPMDFKTDKIHLKFQIQGEVGQTFDDLVHVTEIRFAAAGDPAATVNGRIRGRLEGIGKLEQAAAYGTGRLRSYEGKVDAAKGTYSFEDLPKDTYDLAFLTDRGIYIGLSAATAPSKVQARPLEAGDPRALAAEVAKFRDFFDEQTVLALEGNRETAKALVLQRRVAPMHNQEELKGRQLLRLDLWVFGMRQTEWRIAERGRANLFRYYEPKEGPRRESLRVPELGGIVLDPAAQPRLDVNYRAVPADAAAPAKKEP